MEQFRTNRKLDSKFIPTEPNQIIDTTSEGELEQ